LSLHLNGSVKLFSPLLLIFIGRNFIKHCLPTMSRPKGYIAAKVNKCSLGVVGIYMILIEGFQAAVQYKFSQYFCAFSTIRTMLEAFSFQFVHLSIYAWMPVNTTSYRSDASTSLNSLSMVTMYTPPCCRSRYVWYMKQNRHTKYCNE